MSSGSEIMSVEEAALVLLSLKTKAPSVTHDDVSDLMPPRKMRKLDSQEKTVGVSEFGSSESNLLSNTNLDEDYVPMSLFTKFVSRLEGVMGQKREYEMLKNNLDAFMKQQKVLKYKGDEIMHEDKEVLHDEEKEEASLEETDSQSDSDDDRDRNVPIGTGKTCVPASVLRNIDWTSYTIATRTLLQTLFTRRTLATHSLTGKKSPAFADKPAKKRLDPNIVGDIVQVVSKRCGVPARLVRGCITTKCADETKMMRNSL